MCCNGNFGGSNSCAWVIFIVILVLFLNNNNNGCGCN